MYECIIKGIPIKFPFEPYDLQKEYMGKVIECLQNNHNGMLESPTGTGKTLSLLCSSLAWLEIKKAQMQAEFQIKGFNMDPEKETDMLLNKLNKVGGSSSNTNGSAFVQFPQIIYASRTHSQLTQAMNELKRSSYNYMKASVLGSREQMCIHPEIKVLASNALKVQMCGLKVKQRACFYQNRVDREKDNPAFTKNTVIDIEDLVKFGEHQKFCPYYMSKELKQVADIVFMPYNYLLDPKIRKVLGLDITNSVVILDEAHNVERICEDSASLEIKSTDITLCISEVTEVMRFISREDNEYSFQDTPPDFTPQELVMFKEMLLKFESELDNIQLNSSKSVTFDGDYIFELFAKAGIKDGNRNMVGGLIDRICTFLATATEGPFQKKGTALQLFGDYLEVIFLSSEEEYKQKLKKCFNVHVRIEESNKSNHQFPKSSKSQRVLNFWCFNPGFGMNNLMRSGVKCIILTSGTLSPLNPLINELGLDVKVSLENPHIVTGDQVCVKILSNGPDGTLLNSSFKTRNDPTYIKSLGMTINNLTRVIPGGLLIFFPSYSIMRMCQEKWQENGLWASICQCKQIYVEPQDKEAFQAVMKEYYELANDPAQGAIFMGVCRGKVSEGLDFVDGNGRAVIITGLPYPPLLDPRIVLKKKYLDVCRLQNKEYLTGDSWYQLEATKAVNQAIGRVIRHRNDYGAIILLDSRFNNPQLINRLSLWLRSHVKHTKIYGQVMRELNVFYRNAEVKFPVNGERKQKESLKLDFSQSCFSGASKRSKENKGEENDVVVRKRQGDSSEAVIKRTKFVLKSNINRGESSSLEMPSEPTMDDIKAYIKLVQSKLGKEDYAKFINVTKSYAVQVKIEPVIQTFHELFDHRHDLHYLLPGMRTFLKPDHQTIFDEYVSSYTG